jgi:hypothetical protein
MIQACAVHCCDYVVEAYIEDFPVCALHDARQTAVWLEKLLLPCAGWSCDRPIVYPSKIELSVEHFEPKESRSGMKAFDDPRIQAIDVDDLKGVVHPDQDLTAS